MGYVDRLGARLHVTQAAAPAHQTLADWLKSKRSKLGPDRALLGGELGAQHLGLNVVAATATIHVRTWDASTLKALQLAPSPRGPITVRRIFGDLNADPDRPQLADPLLLRAELLAIPDERLDACRAELAARVTSMLSRR